MLKSCMIIFYLFISFSFGKVSDSFNSFNGYINVDTSNNANLFFWMIESEHDPTRDPTILWLSGGPGCSSLISLFYGNGPWTLDASFNKIKNDNAWNVNSNILYVDQPIGTGFSYANSDNVHDISQVASSLWTFLQNFLTKYTKYQSTDLYIFGESYAGHFIPALAQYILQQNSANQGIKLRLSAIAIGNGWVDPLIQFASIGVYAYQNSLITTSVYTQVNYSYSCCVDLINAQDWVTADLVCDGMINTITQALPNLNIYNVKNPCSGSSYCANLTIISAYLNANKQSWSVPTSLSWEACSSQVDGNFLQDRYQSVMSILKDVLGKGIRVYLYSGDLSLTNNYLGVSNVASSMVSLKTPTVWRLNGNSVALVSASQGLTYLRIYNAGSLVSHDQPFVAQNMLANILNNQPFPS